ncbi:hypothetical protein AAFC00_005020 [Neodothiora populina]|uniref:Glutamine amidotransferase domain-containing protein n=1 Tax=Neodothiora populina TaxID=2781224 RepID=A0ABR3P486_9PEZI
MAHNFSGSETPNKVRMMVFETDEPHPDTTETKGSFGQIFDRLFKTAGDNHTPPLEIETAMRFVVEPKGGSLPSLDDLTDVHAILITGSMYDAHGDDEWILKLLDLLKELWLHRPDIRFSGVCFGHQLLCRLLGSTVEPTEGSEWELAHTPVKLTEIGQKLFRTSEDILHLHQMHQDHVANAPSPSTTDLLPKNSKVHVWGSTEKTQVQGVYLKDKLFTSQGHLGFDEDMVRRQIDMRVENGGIKDEEHAEISKETAELEHDGEMVAAAILRLFHGEDDDIP